MAKKLVFGPTFEEMLDPSKINKEIRKKAIEAKKKKDALNPINLYNITWIDENNQPYYYVLPKNLTCVEANIVLLYGKEFPTGSHKVGATYSCTIEKQVQGEIVPGVHKIVWPSTGNYGIGGAYVGPRMGYESIVILPELMSKERFELIKLYGADYIKTPGCESNVKEIYDKAEEMRRKDKRIRVLNQFCEFGNYRFHYYVTGNTIIRVVKELKEKGIGNGRVSAFVSAMGSGGTIAAGERIKQEFYESKTIGLEPIQCPTIFLNGFGGHDIQGIGDKHVTWIHNVMMMDAIMCIDDVECKRGLQLVSEPGGMKYLRNELGIDKKDVKFMSNAFGISSICNIIGAIKTAKYYEMGENDVIFTIATDSIDRYYSVLEDMRKKYGKIDSRSARAVHQTVFNPKLDWIEEGTFQTRKRWFNLKYYTWVEQRGKSVEELVETRKPEFWIKQQKMVQEIDEKILEMRDS
ncbi:MAG: PLP-dependent cysteine synthase family protein [Thermoplasmata archaeon]